MNNDITRIVKELFDQTVEPVITRPDPQFGDFSTNVALQLSGVLQQPPREIAERIAEQLRHTNQYASVGIAGPGFINVSLRDDALLAYLVRQPRRIFEGHRIVFEYSCPNAFKELHTGHLYQTIFGDSLARLMERVGAKVHRTSFGGDVGLHVAKCVWGMVAALDGENPEGLASIDTNPFARARWISACYVEGARAYEESDEAKQTIDELNKTIYGFHETNDDSSNLARIYWTTRQWSYEYFDAFYKQIEVDSLHYYAESQTAPVGLEVVREQLEAGVLRYSDGAVVFEGDESKHLHTRVFITSKGLPTYETKDIGVIWLEKEQYNFDHRYLLTGNDQTEYMRVVFAAAEAFRPELAGTMTHLTNGTVRFADGQKMSSRLGNVTRALDVLEHIREKVADLVDNPRLIEPISLGAIKYAFTRYSLGGDIAFNSNDTVSLTGNSGPYLQYAHARARRIIEKSTHTPEALLTVNPEDRVLVKKLGEYSDIIELAGENLQLHPICTYLFELSQEFNRYYEQNRVIGDTKEAHRLGLVRHYADVLKDGLALLGITAPNVV